MRLDGRRLALAMTALVAASTLASASEYTSSNADWHGLGYLEVTAREARVTLDAQPVLDWGVVTPKTNLLILYPSSPPPAGPLMSFLKEGGEVIIADDHGASGELLEALGVERVSPSLSMHGAFHGEGTAFPIFKATRDHFLFYNVDSVVGNHPSALTGAGVPVLSFEAPGEHLVIEVAVGKGRALVLADPSLLLNDMLRSFYGNKQFAANLLRVFCDADPCVVKVLGPKVEYRGTYQPATAGFRRFNQRFNEAGAQFDEAIQDAALDLRSMTPSALLSWLLFTVLLAGLWGVLRSKSGAVTRVEMTVESEPQLLRRGLLAARDDANFAVEAMGVLEAVSHRLKVRRGPTGVKKVESAEVDRAMLRLERERDSLQGPHPPVLSAEHFLEIFEDAKKVLGHTPSIREVRHERS